MRPVISQSNPHAVTRDELRKHIRFIRDLVETTDTFIGNKNAAIRLHGLGRIRL